MDNATAVEILQRMEKRLFGEYGDNGLIGKLRDADEENRRDVEEKHLTNQIEISRVRSQFDKAKWLVIGFIAAWGFLTGSGTVTLERLLKFMGGG